jgi:hypothetical protein
MPSRWGVRHHNIIRRPDGCDLRPAPHEGTEKAVALARLPRESLAGPSESFSVPEPRPYNFTKTTGAYIIAALVLTVLVHFAVNR